MRGETLRKVIAEIYECVGSEGFAAPLGRMRRLVGGSSAMLFTPFVDAGSGGIGLVDHVNPELFRLYRAYYWDKDPWAREGERRGVLRAGNTVSDEAFIEPRMLKQEEIYTDLLVPFDAVRLLCHIVAHDDDAVLPRTYLSFYRGVGAKPFGSAEESAIAELGPHVLQALRLEFRLRRAEADRSSMQDSLDHATFGLVIVDANRRVLHMNRAAERWCASGHGLCTSRQHDDGLAIRAMRPADDSQLQRAIDAVLAFDPRSAEAHAPRQESLAIRSADGLGMLIVTALSLPQALLTDARAPGRRAAVFLESPTERLPSAHRLFSALFGFTPAECRIADAIASGEAVPRIADRLAISENTLRTHLKSLYAKARVRGVAPLAALLSRVASSHAAAHVSGRPRVP